MRETVARRFEEAGLSGDRFVSVEDGQKMCVDHDTRYDDPTNVPGRNYGIYADGDDQAFVLDVDDHENDTLSRDSRVAVAALSGLPQTLELKSPHVPADDAGGHRIYELSGDKTPAELFKERLGANNPVASWGEVIAKNKYVVGAGSQIDGCDKDWHDCSEEGEGSYEIKRDAEIATVGPEEVISALAADPDLEDSETTDDDDDGEKSGEGGSGDRGQKTATREYDREEIEEMLSHLPGDQHFDDWTRTGYALYDWDDGETGKEVFEKWSRDNRKWEEEDSQYQIDYIWENGEQASDDPDDNSNASVGTLVHLAKESGWTRESAPSYDESEVERAEDLLQAECGPESPAGEMTHRNGQYGYWWEKREDGEIVEREFQPVTNFTLETLEHLKTDDSELLRIRVHPAHPMEDEYDVEIHPTVFNETRSFKEEVVRGRTTRYEPGKRSQQALNDLRETVGSQMVPTRAGVEHIGLAGEDYSEWVTPKGTIDGSGAADDPEHRYYAKGGASDSDGGALARKWQLDPETLSEYDTDDVAEILELLPQTRRHDRGLPILGWFYAAPLRPLIHDWEGEFNLLQVVGSTGTGKTSTLKAFWEAFGMQPDPFSASDTPFTLMKHMASSNGIPVWIDEYKPADIRNDRLDTLHRRLREVTKGTAVSKGRANLGEVLFQIQSPVVVSGEQKFSQSVPAVRRRSIMTTLSEEPTKDGTSYTRAFSKLVGTAYEDSTGDVQYPSGYNLTDHARAFYEFVLSQDADELESLWNQCREDTGDLLAERGLAFEPTEFQGAQTILFGVQIYRRFAETVGADKAHLPTDEEVADAFEHFGSNIGKNGQRRGYDDTFLELFAQAVKAEYIESEEDFRFVESQKWGTEILAFHMPSVYAGVKRYVRDYNLTDEYNIIGKTDYLTAFRDKTDREDSHVLKTNHTARLEGGNTKCVVIDPERTRQKLGSDFDLRAVGYTTEEEGSESDESDDNRQPEHPDPVQISDIDPEKQDIASVVADIEFGQYDGRDAEDGTPAWTATLSDDSGEAELVVWDEDKIPKFYDSTGVFEPDALDVRGAQTSKYDDTLQLVVGDATTIYKAPGDGQGQLDSATGHQKQAAPDGGELEGVKSQILEALRTKFEGQAVSAPQIAPEIGTDPDTVKERLKTLAGEGRVRDTGDGYALNT